MAKFHIGQRVKRIEQGICPDEYGYTGWTGTVIGIDGPNLNVTYDNGITAIGCDPGRFVPLTDPQAEQFMEWIRALDKAPIRELQPDEMERVRSAG